MEIYDSIGAKGYEIIHTLGGYDDDQLLDKLDGTPRLATWIPVRVKRVRGSLREAFRPADLPYKVGGTLILRRSAVDALRDMLDASGELLPLHDEGGVELYVLNVRALDALDEPRSTICYFEGDRIACVDKPVFIRSALDGVDIFTLRRCTGRVYFSDRFVARVKAAKLKGLDFTKVWSLED